MDNISLYSLKTNEKLLKRKVNKGFQPLIALNILGVSLFLYLFAPNAYSYKYCLVIFMVYVVSIAWIISATVINKNYFNFHVLFFISFLFVNFIYPIFLYPISPTYFSVFKKSFNEAVITKATALALLGSSSYILGVSICLRKKYPSPIQLKIKTEKLQYLLSYLVYFIFAVILCYTGTEIIRGRFGATGTIPPGLLAIFQVSIGLAVILELERKKYNKSIFSYIRRINKPILILFLFYIFLFLYVGDRGPAIQIILITLCAFSLFVLPIRMKGLIFTVLAGMLILTFVGYARSKNITASESGVNNFISRGAAKFEVNSLVDIGMDLIVNNRNLYVGYDYANKNGLSYGQSMIRHLFAPFPGIPSLTTYVLFDSTPNELSSGSIITDISNSTYGLGSNIVIDLYMGFGLIGVFLFMFLLGYTVIRFQIKANQRKNFGYIIGYIFLVAYSVYLPRSTVFEPLRHILWAIGLFYFLKEFTFKLFPHKGNALFIR
jgi:oligosaccharide repeat unit polymerase